MLLVSLIPIAITLPMAQPAEAWGLQTHMFIVNEAVAGISDEGWQEAFEYYIPELMTGSTTHSAKTIGMTGFPQMKIKME